MTSKTSWFNAGIFKAALRRYIWGGVLYAILLFMCTSMVLLFDVNPETYRYTIAEDGMLILDDMYLFLPVFISCIVPTVMALLAYRFIHSKKTAVFVHSLPVSRRANYISTLLASFVLMGVPVLLNGGIMALLSVFRYGAFFDVGACLIWTGMNLVCIFLMFSVATLSAFMTGNTFAAVAINGLLHCIVIIVLGSFSTLASVFLYGYYETEALLEIALEYNFVNVITAAADGLSAIPLRPIDLFSFAIVMLQAMVYYAAAYLLYRRRRMESVEDVAAYRCLNPIYKYLITVLAALGSFGIFSYTIEDGSWFAFIVAFIVSAVVYFAVEMILKKSLRIWRSYKGYLAFVGAFAAVLCFFAFTGFFGFETRVPESDMVESVTINESRLSYWYGYYIGDFYEESFVANPEVIEYAIAVHRELTEDEAVYTVRTFPTERTEQIFLTYKLKNGRRIIRRYYVTEQELCRVFDTLYKWEDYKRKNLEFFAERFGTIYGLRLEFSEHDMRDPDLVEELVHCIEQDLLALDYTQLRNDKNWSAHLPFEYIEENGRRTLHQQINANFTRTVSWLREKGYEAELLNPEATDFAVLNAAQWQEHQGGEKTALMEAAAVIRAESYAYEIKTIDKIPGAVRIADWETKAELRDLLLTIPVRYQPEQELTHYVCSVDDGGNLSLIAAFSNNAEIAKFAK